MYIKFNLVALRLSDKYYSAIMIHIPDICHIVSWCNDEGYCMKVNLTILVCNKMFINQCVQTTIKYQSS